MRLSGIIAFVVVLGSADISGADTPKSAGQSSDGKDVLTFLDGADGEVLTSPLGLIALEHVPNQSQLRNDDQGEPHALPRRFVFGFSVNAAISPGAEAAPTLGRGSIGSSQSGDANASVEGALGFRFGLKF